MKNLIFSFNDLGSKSDSVARQVSKYFSRAGSPVVQTDVSPRVMRSSGISYREIRLVHADSQTTTFRIKATGDIFQVLLNNKLLPIRSQDDHVAAITEIVKAMDSGRSKFQKLLAAAKVRPPAGIRTAAPKMEQVLIGKRDALKAAIAEVRAEIATYTGALTA